MRVRWAFVMFLVVGMSLVAPLSYEPGVVAATMPRLAGADRYETAARVAERVVVDGMAGDTVLLTTGEKFPDAIVSGGWRSPAAVLLTRKDSLPPATRQILEESWVKNVLIVGGPAVVSDSIESDLVSMGKTVTRHWGATRYETSFNLLKADLKNGPFDEIWVASGEVFQDQLIAAAAARRTNSPFVLVPGGRTLGTQLESLISAADSTAAVKIRVVDSTGRLAGMRSSRFDLLHHNGDQYSLTFGTQLKSSSVVVASGENWPDALGGLRLVRADRGLILSPKLCAADATSSHLTTGGSIIALGGPSALSDSAVKGERCTPLGFGTSRLFDAPPEFDESGFRTSQLMSVRPIASEAVVPYSIKVGPGVPAAYAATTRQAIEILLRMLPKDQTRRVITRVNVWFSSDPQWLKQEIIDADPRTFGDKTEFLNDFSESATHWARGNRPREIPAPLNVLARVPEEISWLPEPVRPAIWAETLTKRISELVFMGNQYLARASGRTQADHEMCWVQKGFGTLLGMEAASRATGVAYTHLRDNWVSGMMRYPKTWNLTLNGLSRPGSSPEYPCNLLGAGQNVGMLAAEMLVYEFGLEKMIDFVLRAEEVRYPQAFEETFGFSLNEFERRYQTEIEPILAAR